jgi:hypothetical protein
VLHCAPPCQWPVTTRAQLVGVCVRVPNNNNKRADVPVTPSRSHRNLGRRAGPVAGLGYSRW